MHEGVLILSKEAEPRVMFVNRQARKLLTNFIGTGAKLLDKTVLLPIKISDESTSVIYDNFQQSGIEPQSLNTIILA